MSTIVIGGDHVGAALADRLREAGPVAFLDDSPQIVDRARESGVDGHVVDPMNRRDLETAVDEPTTAIVSAREDSVNFLIAQHLRTAFDIDRIVVRVNDPHNRDAFEERGFITVSTADALADAIGDAIETDRRRQRSSSELSQ